MYVMVKSGTAQYYAVENLRLDYPNTSFPAVITDEIAAEFNVFPCAMPPAPVVDHTKDVSIGAPKKVDGVWTQVWDVTDASQEEIASRVQMQWDGIRAERNMLLNACDWTQLPDAPVDHAVWAEYRQQLRDVTTQSDPFNIVWPATPV